MALAGQVSQAVMPAESRRRRARPRVITPETRLQTASIAILDSHREPHRPPGTGRYLPWRDSPGDARPRKRPKFEQRSDDDAAAKRRQTEAEAAFKEDEYMRDGLSHDDHYIMVEDELLQIAKSYTAKLHSAELARLQEQLARRKSQKAAAAAASQQSQPKVTVAMSKQRQLVERKRAHDAAVKQAAGVKQEEPTYNPKFASRSLGRLMTTSAQRLDAVLPLPPLPGKGIKPATRAAAGFMHANFKKPSSTQTSPSAIRRQVSYIIEDANDEDGGQETGSSDGDDEDDLDAMPKRKEPTRVTPISRKASLQDIRSGIALSKHPAAVPPREPIRKSVTAKPASRSLSSSPISTRPPSRYSAALPSKLPATPSLPASASKPTPPSTTSKHKHRINLVDSDSDDYVDAEQAARWRRRKELAASLKSGAKS
ncbi:hypothetical protein Dda_3999 [Drechslerella dactyloides]|uniref:Uncharacterized protein n=1 Tax=Drechslerella dactyloides TaxID=74499 RepID=A0AAD6J199_DREDA|nr:hypothetical protein Dda_3999 [Drechslerella dactyloides]